MTIQQPIFHFETDELIQLDRPWVCCGLIVSAGFESDGASVPRFLWGLAGSHYEGDTLRAALWHDAAYSSEMWSRDVCDKGLYNILRLCGVNRVRAWLYYAAVRSFGWIVWRNHTEESIRRARAFVFLSN